VFQKNSQESIFQIQLNKTRFPYNVTYEGNYLIPFDPSLPPNNYVSNSLLNDFTADDLRKIEWLALSNTTEGQFYYPFKYKLGPSESIQNNDPPQYYTVQRLAEVYLNRSEARAQQNKIDDAVKDLNKIRERAGLLAISNSIGQQPLLDSIKKERRLELFCEWGHRWLDLKRWNLADAVLGAAKSDNWNSTDVLYPIPSSEITRNPNLTQNNGYKN
jgi:hypothetical protein